MRWHDDEMGEPTDLGEVYWRGVLEARITMEEEEFNREEEERITRASFNVQSSPRSKPLSPWLPRHDTILKGLSLIPSFALGSCQALAVPYFLNEGVPFSTAFLILCVGPMLLREIEPFVYGCRKLLSVFAFGTCMGCLLLLFSYPIGRHIGRQIGGAKHQVTVFGV